jgi:GNAT superfamily N-acetyltransferase
VWLRSRRASASVIPASIHTDEQVEAWLSKVVLVERETWVTDGDDGVIVAVLVLEPGWIDQLYVDPDFTGKGIGSQLLDLAKGRNPDGLDLWTFQANTSARRFYERHGFIAVESTEGDNEEQAPDVRYHWPAAGGTGG